MRLIFISDTHLKHGELRVPPGDILLHAGDLSGRGTLPEVARFMDWFGAMPHRHKVLIAGNHDFLAEQQPTVFRALVPPGVTYLNDSGTEIGGIKIWGSPVSPWFFDWAFNRQRGADIRRHWDLIPDDTDILITHGPPYGILDKVVRDPRPVGCRDLLHRVGEIDVKICAFGHIHEAYGWRETGGTLFLNASILDENYDVKNRPLVVDWRSRTDFELVED